jgi:hypothetical protein
LGIFSFSFYYILKCKICGLILLFVTLATIRLPCNQKGRPITDIFFSYYHDTSYWHEIYDHFVVLRFVIFTAALLTTKGVGSNGT